MQPLFILILMFAFLLPKLFAIDSRDELIRSTKRLSEKNQHMPLETQFTALLEQLTDFLVLRKTFESHFEETC